MHESPDDTSSERIPAARESVPPAHFERRWRERFAEFAALREDDAGIAGWSASGLESRFRFFRNIWKDAPPGCVYLDVGCGAGTYSRWLAERGLHVVGIDYSQPTLIKAKERTGSDVAYCVADATRLPFADGSVDGIVCLGVLQALRESGPLLQELGRVVRSGGTVYIDALNYNGLAAVWDRQYRRWKGKPMHLRYEKRRTVGSLLSAAGFDDTDAHWLPLMPSRLRRLQPAFESKLATRILAGVNWMGNLASHAYLFVARRSDRAVGAGN